MIDMLKFTEIFISVLLIFFILVQNKNVSLNLSSMSGGMGEVTKRGPEKVLHNITIVLGVLFILNSVALYVS
ncbi:MAG: preprotein translocase subunit SecG [Candidatus Gracilibacteria bacterium]|nr:preprotein translocase subunit SecG [Candidatus Gracilibacteria bacterium]